MIAKYVYVEHTFIGLKDTKFTDLKTRLEKNKASLSDLQSQVKDAMEQELDGIIEEVWNTALFCQLCHLFKNIFSHCNFYGTAKNF